MKKAVDRWELLLSIRFFFLENLLAKNFINEVWRVKKRKKNTTLNKKVMVGCWNRGQYNCYWKWKWKKVPRYNENRWTREGKKGRRAMFVSENVLLWRNNILRYEYRTAERMRALALLRSYTRTLHFFKNLFFFFHTFVEFFVGLIMLSSIDSILKNFHPTLLIQNDNIVHISSSWINFRAIWNVLHFPFQTIFNAFM